jgi:hypothetical protein
MMPRGSAGPGGQAPALPNSECHGPLRNCPQEHSGPGADEPIAGIVHQALVYGHGEPGVDLGRRFTVVLGLNLVPGRPADLHGVVVLVPAWLSPNTLGLRAMIASPSSAASAALVRVTVPAPES